MATDHFNTVSKWLVARAVVFVLFGVYWPGKVSPPVINCSSLLTAAAVPAAAEEPVVPATAATGIALAAAATRAAAHADSLRRGVGHHDAERLLARLRGRDTLLHGACAGLLHTLQGADVDRHFTRLRHRFANGARPLTLLRFIMANVDRHFTRLRHQLANSA